jgi:hypothetical protein
MVWSKPPQEDVWIDGELSQVEEGPPQELLNNPQSKFSSLVHASHA